MFPFFPFRVDRRHVLASLTFLIIASGLSWALQSSSGAWDRNQRVGTFQVRSEIPLGEENGKRLLQAMVKLRADVESTLHLRGQGAPLHVSLFKSRESYLEYLQARIPVASQHSALFVDGKQGGQIYIYHRPGIEQDVRHECTHAVLHQSLNQIPLWLDEGLAEYFEVQSEFRIDGNPYLTELRVASLAGWTPNLQRLEALQTVHDLQATDYRDSWGWVHFFLHGPVSGRQIFHAYLQDLQSGGPAGRLSDRLRASMPDMDVQLINHLRTW